MEHVDDRFADIRREGHGTSVYVANGERLGAICDIMLDKRSGKNAYAVMSVGGFLGIAKRCTRLLGQY